MNQKIGNKKIRLLVFMTILAVGQLAARPAVAQTKGERRGSYVITHPLENPANPRTRSEKGRQIGRPPRPEANYREPLTPLAKIPDPEPHVRALPGGTSRRRGKYFYEAPTTISLRPRTELGAKKLSIPSPVVRRRPSTSKEALKGLR